MCRGAAVERRAYLIAKVVRVGDVVLTSSPKIPFGDYWPSQLVRLLTLSCYTHASLLVTRLGLLETNGFGQTSQITVPVLRIQDRWLLIDLAAPRAMVLRPTAEAIESAGGEETFRRNVAASSLAYLGRKYSSEFDLVSASVLRPLRRLLPRTDRSRLRKWSCSGLVAQAYADAGLDLVKGDFSRAAPGTFARSRRIRSVPEAVLTLRTGEDDVPPLGPAPPSSVVTGVLSVKKTDGMIEAAVRTATASSFTIAIQDLEAELSRLIREPVQSFGNQLRYEAILREQGLL